MRRRLKSRRCSSCPTAPDHDGNRSDFESGAQPNLISSHMVNSSTTAKSRLEVGPYARKFSYSGIPSLSLRDVIARFGAVVSVKFKRCSSPRTGAKRALRGDSGSVAGDEVFFR
jgi:hypothetical protein